jgi:3-oxoadipate enol-lactonase
MIHAVETGQADGPPLVLAHGLATDLHLWDAVVPYLAPRFRVIRYDARGHGKTPPPAAQSWPMEALVADALSVLDRFGLKRAAFAGLSMGGMTGLGLALDHPQRVSRLVVMNARADAPEPYAKAWDQRIATLHEHGLAALAEPTLARWFTAGFQADAAAMARMHAMVLRTSPAGFEGCGRALQGLDYRRRLPDMTVPTLYLIGDEDQGAPAHVMQDMAAATPGSQSETITNSGHLSAVEQPRQVAEALLRFLS